MLMKKISTAAALVAVILTAHACKHTNNDDKTQTTDNMWAKESMNNKPVFSFAEAQDQGCKGLTPFEINQINVVLNLDTDAASCSGPATDSIIVKKMATNNNRKNFFAKCLSWFCANRTLPKKNN
jgi:hypothetical protein